MQYLQLIQDGPTRSSIRELNGSIQDLRDEVLQLVSANTFTVGSITVGNDATDGAIITINQDGANPLTSGKWITFESGGQSAPAALAADHPAGTKIILWDPGYNIGVESGAMWLQSDSVKIYNNTPTLRAQFKSTGRLHLATNSNGLELGASANAHIYYDGSHLYIEPRGGGGSGNLFVSGGALNQTIGGSTITLSGSLLSFSLGGNNIIRAATSGGAVVFQANGVATNVVYVTGTGLRLDDTYSIILGTGGDTSISNSGSVFKINTNGMTASFLVDDTYGISATTSGNISFAGNVFIDTSPMIFSERSTPSTPSTNQATLFLNSSDGKLTLLKDDASTVDLETPDTIYAAVKGSTYITMSRTGVTGDNYLTADNVAMASNRGWCPTRNGSITGVSCSMTAGAVSAHGTIDIEVHKNGASVFSAQVTTSGSADHVWSATQDAGIDTFTGGTDELALYINYGTFAGTATFHGVMELVMDGDTPVNLEDLGDTSRINGASGAAGGSLTWQKLSADSSDVTSTTLSSAVMSTTGVGAGTWLFTYTLLYQTAATTTGIAFGINHTGTVTKMRATWRNVATGAATGVGDSSATTVAGQALNGKSGGTLDAILGSASAGVDTANTDILAVLEGIIVISATGTLELKIASEVSLSAVRIMAGSSLELRKIG